MNLKQDNLERLIDEKIDNKIRELRQLVLQ